MGYLAIILVALGLSIDSFVASISCGLKTKILKLCNIVKTILIFGAFQSLMTLLGWAVGMSFAKIITGMDHWIAFTLLSIIGIRMIYESRKKCKEKKEQNLFSSSTLILLGIATSIDALAVGISFAFLNVEIINATLIIGATTILISFIGIIIGNRIGHLFEKGIQTLGGIVLIGIGIKILIEHLS